MALGERIHAVPPAPAIEHIGDQHRIVDRSQLDAVALEHEHVELDVVPDLEDRSVLEQRLDQRQRLGKRRLRKAAAIAEIEAALRRPVPDRHIACLPRRDRHREADEVAIHAIKRRRLDIDCEASGITRRRDPPREPVETGDGFIGRTVERHIRHPGRHDRRSGRWRSWPMRILQLLYFF